jgi:RHS repeat-associated protein
MDILVTATLPDGGDNNAARIADAEKSAYLPPDPETFLHDADGNLTQDGKWSYTWDAENRLIAMETLPGAVAAGVGQLKLEFGYDSQGRRISKKVYAWDSGLWSLSSDTLYLWDGWNLAYELAEFADGFNAEKGYVWGSDLSGSFQGAGGVGGLLMVTLVQGSTFHPAYDGNGNIMGYYAADTGESVAEFEYSPFGELIRATGSKVGEFDFRFSTKPIDPETGLVAYQLRYYNPETGRWLSRDLIGEEGGLNLYGMVGNDAISRWDYLGLSNSCCPDGAQVDCPALQARVQQLRNLLSSIRNRISGANADLGATAKNGPWGNTVSGFGALMNAGMKASAPPVAPSVAYSSDVGSEIMGATGSRGAGVFNALGGINLAVEGVSNVEYAAEYGGNSWGSIGDYTAGSAQIGLGGVITYSGVSSVAHSFTQPGSFAHSFTRPGARLGGSGAVGSATGVGAATDIGFAAWESNLWLDQLDAVEGQIDQDFRLLDRTFDLYADSLTTYRRCCE